MSTTTPNLNLVKPATTEQVDVSVLNSNFDAIDSGIPARLYNGTDTLYCKEGTTKGFLIQDNQIKVVPVTWNAGVPAVGTAVGYIDSTGNYHSSNYDLDTLGDSVNDSASQIATLQDSVSKWVLADSDPSLKVVLFSVWSDSTGIAINFRRANNTRGMLSLMSNGTVKYTPTV